MRSIVAIFCFIFISQAWGQDCPRAIELYNQGTLSSSLELKERRFKEAISLCSDPKVRAKAYNNLADTYEKGGRISQALIHYRKALEVDPWLATAYFSVGDIFFSFKDYHSAAAMYKKGLRYEPGDEMSRQRKKEAEIRSQRYMLIYFDFDSANIPVRYLKRINELGSAIKDYRNKNQLGVKVVGHTCNLGPSAYNLRLSFRRSEEVAKFISARLSLGPEQVFIVGRGEESPILSNNSREARVLNRRVEVIVTTK